LLCFDIIGFYMLTCWFGSDGVQPSTISLEVISLNVIPLML